MAVGTLVAERPAQNRIGEALASPPPLLAREASPIPAPSAAPADVERRQITVMFSDLVGITERWIACSMWQASTIPPSTVTVSNSCGKARWRGGVLPHRRSGNWRVQRADDPGAVRRGEHDALSE
ncbi:MAG: hypothetical protein ACR2PL_28045 [Dehalococcoidia bacterium]